MLLVLFSSDFGDWIGFGLEFEERRLEESRFEVTRLEGEGFEGEKLDSLLFPENLFLLFTGRFSRSFVVILILADVGV